MAGAENHLIERLPQRDRRRFMALCEPVQLTLSEILCEPGARTRHVYFPVEGFISLISLSDERSALEVGMVGREGMLGAQVSLGVLTAPLRAVVQGEGSAWRIAVPAFLVELARDAALARDMKRYLYVTMTQLASSASCTRFHLIGERLARWLLMSQDRAHSDRFHVTQEFLAYMLGVRRVGVTSAASALQRRGLIEYRRGSMTVIDRRGLEAAACSCYGADTLTYAALLD